MKAKVLFQENRSSPRICLKGSLSLKEIKSTNKITVHGAIPMKTFTMEEDW